MYQGRRSARQPEMPTWAVTRRGESRCDERTDMESGLVRSDAGTAQRRGECEHTGKCSLRARERQAAVAGLCGHVVSLRETDPAVSDAAAR
jgi:hypothetical protein